jgi:hypothetical protein
MALNQQTVTYFSMEKRMLIITQGQAFSYMTRLDQQLTRAELVTDRISYM